MTRTNPNAAWTSQADRFLSELRKVREDPGDVEAVHDARVAARRLVALGELRFERARGWDRLRAKLDRIVERLGRARNLDVIMELLGGGRLLRDLRRRRRGEERVLRRWLTLGRIRRWRGKLFDASFSPISAESLTRRVHWIGRLGAHRDLERDVKMAHEIRRQVRFLRYGWEALGFDRAHPGVHAFLLRLQEAGGAWHDCVIADRFLKKRGTEDSSLARALRRRAKGYLRLLAGWNQVRWPKGVGR